MIINLESNIKVLSDFPNSKMRHGFEQELQIVNSEKGGLVNKQKEILSLAKKEIISHPFAGISGEAYPSQIEYRVGICEGLSTLENGILDYRKILMKCASKLKLSLLACGVNPIVPTSQPGENFGDHHHVGVDSAEEALRYHNLIRIFIPELIAMTANSPIYNGSITPYKSFRIWRSPHIKLPPFLSSNRIKDIIDNSFGQSPKMFAQPRYWDVTPFVKSSLPTVEIRLFDAQFSLDIIIAVALVLQSLLRKMKKDKWDTDYWDPRHNKTGEELLNRNRYAAIKHGQNAKLDLEHRPILKRPNKTSVLQALAMLFEWLQNDLEAIASNSKFNNEWVAELLARNNPNFELIKIFNKIGIVNYFKFLLSQYQIGL